MKMAEKTIYSKTKSVRSILFLIILFNFIVLRNVNSADNEIRFEHISLEKGLSQSTITTILQDKQGFLWFGTQDGLNRYDGTSFSVYKHDPDNPHSISNNFISKLFEDKSGALWIGTRDGLNQFDRLKGTFKHWFHQSDNNQSLSNNFIYSIYEDRSGQLWIGTHTGLNLFDREKETFTRWMKDSTNVSGLNNDIITSIYEDSSGNLWIGTFGSGLHQFDRSTKTFKHWIHKSRDLTSLSDNYVKNIYEDKLGNLWIGTMGGGLNLFDRNHGTFTKWINDQKNSQSQSHNSIEITEDKSGNFWIGTRDGLNLFDRKTNTFVNWRHDSNNPYSLSDNAVSSIFQDDAGTLWIGTAAGGINKFDRGRNKFIHWTHEPGNPNSLINNTVWALCEDRSGILWVGTGEGLNKIDRHNKKITSYVTRSNDLSSLSNIIVNSILEDRSGNLWFGTQNGLNKYNKERGTFTRYMCESTDYSNAGENAIVAIHEDNSGMLWLGTHGGLKKFDPNRHTFTTWIFEPGNPNSLSSNFINNIFKDSAGMLWIATHDGLNRFDSQKETFTHWHHEFNKLHSISNNDILSIYEDKSGRLWIGTMGGLNLFDRKQNTFIHYLEKDGLPNPVIYGILEDTQGNLWLSTNNGLSKFNPNTGKFKNYDVNDGLQSNEFNGNAYFKSIKTGEMFFGGINGFNSFYPDSIQDNPYIPPIIVTAIKRYDDVIKSNISDTDTCKLSYMSKYITFEFLTLNYRNSEKNRYSHILEGFDEEWSKPGVRRFATYTNLDPGNYIFRVKGSNNDDVWNETGVAIHITITPPFWKTWWFRLIVVVSLTGIIFFGYKTRIKNIQTQKKNLEIQVAARTSELTNKNVQLESAYKELRETEAQLIQSEKMASLGILVAGVAHEVNSPNGAITSAADISSRCIKKITECITKSEEINDIKQNSKLQQCLKILFNNNQVIANASNQISKIVQHLKNFARLDEADLQEADVHDGIESTLMLVQHEFKNRIELVKEYGTVPMICCYPNQLNQVFMNLLVNASQAINGKGTITIKTLTDNNNVYIKVSDTGHGITPETINKIFDPGFTTKGVGVGTGLGLSICYNIIKKHKGTISAESTVDKGTTFTITVPIRLNDKNENLNNKQ